MEPLSILLLVAGTSSAAYLMGVRYLRLRRSLNQGIARTLETIGAATVFFVVNILVIVVVVIGFRMVGIFASLNTAGDSVIVAIACLQALVFQFWRYSGPTKE